MAKSESKGEVGFVWIRGGLGKKGARILLISELKICKHKLLSWSKNGLNNSAVNIQNYLTELEQLHYDGGQRDWIRWGMVKNKLWEAYNEEETYWKLKSRQLWLKEGDKNTKYFHSSTLQRRKLNSLDNLVGRDGFHCDSHDKVVKEISNHFDFLFKSDKLDFHLAFKGKTTIEESAVHALKYLKLVINEKFRLHPTLALIGRACREECKVDGYTIPLKFKVWVNVWSMGRDPEYWTEPESFKPKRLESNQVDFLGNNFEYLPFGAGRRICQRMNFGLANFMLSLAQLLYHFDWKMPTGMRPDDIDMSEAEGVSVTRKNGLFLVPTPAIISSN